VTSLFEFTFANTESFCPYSVDHTLLGSSEPKGTLSFSPAAIPFTCSWKSLCWWVWWCTSVIPVLARLRQEDCEFEPSWGCETLSQNQTKPNQEEPLFFRMKTGIPLARIESKVSRVEAEGAEWVTCQWRPGWLMFGCAYRWP
jgi:hypothetical protein